MKPMKTLKPLKTMKNKHKYKKSKANKNKSIKGGKLIDSGGFGCVFLPLLKCVGEPRPTNNYVSKLMLRDNAIQEYADIHKYDPIIKKIKHNSQYFILDKISYCEPDTLSSEDLDNFDKCTALKRHDLTASNINTNLDKLGMLNEPFGGIELDEYMKENIKNSSKLINLNNSMIQLLKNGIIPMNNLNLYHFDIKGANLLVDDTKNVYARIIDWGLSHYFPNKSAIVFQELSRPFQFNLPYSVIIFNKTFASEYNSFLSKNELTSKNVYMFVGKYITKIAKNPKNSHLSVILSDLKFIFNNKLNINEVIVKYIADILIQYTQNNKLNLTNYIPIFLQNVDIWGFVTAYLSIVDILIKQSYLYNNEPEIVEKIKQLFLILFNHNLTPINVGNIVSVLQSLNTVFKIPPNPAIKVPNHYATTIFGQNNGSKVTNIFRYVLNKIIS